MLSIFTDNNSEIRLVGRFIFGEANVLIETEGRIFYIQISNILINFSCLYDKLFCKVEKIVSHHQIKVSICVHPLHIIILSDGFEKGEGDLINHVV